MLYSFLRFISMLSIHIMLSCLTWYYVMRIANIFGYSNISPPTLLAYRLTISNELRKPLGWSFNPERGDSVICGIDSRSPTDSASQSRHPHDCRSSVCVHIRSHGCHRSPSLIIARNYRCGPTRENRGRDLSSVDRIIEYSSQDDDCQQRCKMCIKAATQLGSWLVARRSLCLLLRLFGWLIWLNIHRLASAPIEG